MADKQYGLQILPGDRVTIYPSKKAAEAAKERMRRFPTTKHAKLMEQDYQVSEWRVSADEP